HELDLNEALADPALELRSCCGLGDVDQLGHPPRLARGLLGEPGHLERQVAVCPSPVGARDRARELGVLEALDRDAVFAHCRLELAADSRDLAKEARRPARRLVVANCDRLAADGLRVRPRPLEVTGAN